MNKILFILLILCAFVWGQDVEALSVTIPEYYTVTLDSTTTSTVYYIFPSTGGIGSPTRTAIGTTALTSTATQAIHREYNANGALSIGIVTDILTTEESDSLYAYCQSYDYDATKATWYKCSNDTVFFDFDTPQTYTGTSIDYLDWTHGSYYKVSLGGDIIPGAGLAITFGQVTNDNAGAASTLYISFWWQR